MMDDVSIRIGENTDTCFGYLLAIVSTILVTLALLGDAG
jgi:hypothetical protein